MSKQDRKQRNERTETSNILDQYHQNIKKKLSEWRDALEKNRAEKLDFQLLADKMVKEYGIQTTDQKLRMMFDITNPRKIQLAEMIALCQIYDLPIYDICQTPTEPEILGMPEPLPHFRKTGEVPKNSGVLPLNDPHYEGDYYCYFFKSKHLSSMALGGKKGAEAMPLRESRLQIRQEGGMHVATLIDEDNFTMSGKMFVIERSRQVCTRLLDKQGLRMINLLFSYRKYSVYPLMYRTAGMLTISYNERESPLFQKMAIFHIKQDLNDPDVESMIRGILTLDSQDILVEKERFHALVQEDKTFGILQPPVKSYYVFRESDFSNTELPWNYEERVRRILRLRQVSELPPHEIVLDSEDISKFFMTLQLQDSED